MVGDIHQFRDNFIKDDDFFFVLEYKRLIVKYIKDLIYICYDYGFIFMDLHD